MASLPRMAASPVGRAAVSVPRSSGSLTAPSDDRFMVPALRPWVCTRCDPFARWSRGIWSGFEFRCFQVVRVHGGGRRWRCLGGARRERGKRGARGGGRRLTRAEAFATRCTMRKACLETGGMAAPLATRSASSCLGRQVRRGMVSGGSWWVRVGMLPFVCAGRARPTDVK